MTYTCQSHLAAIYGSSRLQCTQSIIVSWDPRDASSVVVVAIVSRMSMRCRYV